MFLFELYQRIVQVGVLCFWLIEKHLEITVKLAFGTTFKRNTQAPIVFLDFSWILNLLLFANIYKRASHDHINICNFEIG